MEALTMLLLEISAFFNCILTFMTSGLLSYLIIRKSPKAMANYRYLMLAFSSFGCLLSIMDVTNQMMLHLHGSGYIVFSRNSLKLPDFLASVYVYLNCSAFGMVICLLCFHFIYRYLAVCKPKRLYFFTFPYSNIFILIFLTVSIEWCIISDIWAGETKEKDDYWRGTMLDNFSLKIENVAYISSIFIKIEPDGAKHFGLQGILLLTNLLTVILTGFTFIIIIGLKTQREMLRSSNRKSRKTSEMQQQLFHALVAQTIIPCILMLIPMLILLLVPFLQFNVGALENFVIPAITTYPIFDAISTIYFIKEYRRSVCRIICRNKVLFLKTGPVKSIVFNVSTRS